MRNYCQISSTRKTSFVCHSCFFFKNKKYILHMFQVIMLTIEICFLVAFHFCKKINASGFINIFHINFQKQNYTLFGVVDIRRKSSFTDHQQSCLRILIPQWERPQMFDDQTPFARILERTPSLSLFLSNSERCPRLLFDIRSVDFVYVQ